MDADLYALLEAAEAARHATRGAFDVRVGPLVTVWSEAAGLGQAPDAQVLEAARQRAAQPVVLGSDALVRLAAGGSIDLGGIAKGFALDRVGRDPALRARAALFNFGRSSIRASGQDFRLRVEDDAGAALGVVTLRDRALSMSSSLSQSSVIGGVRYGHVIDPRSGEPIRERRTALVVAGSATAAEVLSTALLVLDESEARAVLSEQRAEAWVLREDGGDWQTPGWRAATDWIPAARSRG